MDFRVTARWRLGLLAAVCAAFATPAIAADTAPPPIRQFDIPTIEKLGRQMYEQDQEAWKATDILRAKHSDDELKAGKLHGWIVDTFPDHDVVRFVHDGASGPEAYYDVTFPRVGGAPTLASPESSTLSGEDVAQYAARTLALQHSELNCSDTYNTIVLKDPEQDGWLVWIMAATKDPDLIIIGGHYRFTISSDGKSIRQKDVLSKSCLRFSRKAQTGSTGFLMSHVVSLTPIETHAFASLSYKVGFYVGTPDGRAWNVGEGLITQIQQDAPSLDGFAARALLGMNENCIALARKASDPEAKPHDDPLKSVVNATENAQTFSPELPAGDTATSVLCVREDLIPAPNDYQVLRGGFPLYIDDRGMGRPERIGVLEVSGGRVRFRLIKGDPLTAEIKDRLGTRLDQLQTALDDAWTREDKAKR